MKAKVEFINKLSNSVCGAVARGEAADLVEQRIHFFDGWEEAKANGPEAVAAWLNTPITKDDLIAWMDFLDKNKPK